MSAGVRVKPGAQTMLEDLHQLPHPVEIAQLRTEHRENL
jgi:hypothetical protein